MDHRTRIITEKKINDILVEAEMSALSQNNSRGIIAAEYSGRSSVDQNDFNNMSGRGISLHTYNQEVSPFNNSNDYTSRNNNSYAFNSPPPSVTDSNQSQSRVILSPCATFQQPSSETIDTNATTQYTWPKGSYLS